jgi:sec-independent protein translocase protein TatA
MPGGWEWLIIIGVLVLLFGAKRLPEMARSVGQSARVFKGEMKGLKDDEGRNTARGTTAPTNSRTTDPRPSAPAEPTALPPAPSVDGQVNGAPGERAPGVGATAQQPTESVRRDADR